MSLMSISCSALRRSSIAEENSTASKDENNNGAGKQKEALDGVDATTAPQFFTIDSVYLPQTIVNISNILTVCHVLISDTH